MTAWTILTLSLNLVLFFSSYITLDISYCPRDYVSLDTYTIGKIFLFFIGFGWSVISGGVVETIETLRKSRTSNLGLKLFKISLSMTFIAICLGNIHSLPIDLVDIERCDTEALDIS
jgi:hypothetical protein